MYKSAKIKNLNKFTNVQNLNFFLMLLTKKPNIAQNFFGSRIWVHKKTSRSSS